MKTKRTRWWLKSAALLCATVFGLTAFGGIHEWTPADGGTTYWDDEANWTVGTEEWTDYRIGNNGTQVTFRSAVSAEDTDTVLVYNGEHTLVAEDASYGLSKPNATMNFHAPWWFTGTPVLNITSGTYEFGTVDLAPDATYNGSATLNLNGGTLKAASVAVGQDCTVTLNGGTLTTPYVGGTGTLAVGENGGTFAWASDDEGEATIAVALTGSGTLTKTGEGTLIITGSTDAFTGKIAVQAGSVKLGAGAGATVIAAGETKDFDPQPTYTAWTEDFQTSSALSGWTYSGDNRRSSTISERTLSDGSTSKFYRLYLGKGGGTTGISATADYALNLVKSDVYAFEFDLFPKCSWGKENTLTITGKKVVEEEGTPSEETVTLATFTTNESNQGNGGDKTKVRVAVGETTSYTELPIESRGTDVATAAENSTLWYHVIIFGNKDLNKTYLRVLDYNNNEVISQEIGDFATVSALSVIIRTNGNGAAVLGLDNLAYKTLEPAGIPADPIMVVEPESYAGNRTVTITCEDEDAKIYWRSDADSDFAEYTQTITVSESTTIYAYAQNDAGKSANTVAVRVYANVKLNAPSVARRGWYRMQITPGANPATGETPAYVYHYYFNGHNQEETKTTEGDSLVTTPGGHSGNFDVNGTTFWAYMAADGYNSSDRVNYTAYTFSTNNYECLLNVDFYQYNGNTQFYDTDDDGNDITYTLNDVTYRGVRTITEQEYLNDKQNDLMLFSDIRNGAYARWVPSSGGALKLNNLNGSILFKSVKPGSLIYVNADHTPWSPVNLELDTSYTNPDEYVYTVTGEGETVDATLSFTKNKYIYCIKIYEPIPEETDTFAADEATLVDGAFTVPEGTTKITLGGKDVTKGFNIEGTTATLLSPWFAWNGAEFGEGMVVGEETVRLDIDLVEGLYYGPAAATTLEGLARPATLTMYDGTNAAALTTVAKPEGGTAFFTVYVDVKAE